jgi:hypothetical protein
LVRRFHLRAALAAPLSGALAALTFSLLSPIVAAQSGSSPAVAASAQPGGSLEARLQRQEDTEAIRRLLREYGKRLDAGDLQGYASLFAADGEWVGGFGSVKGRDKIAPFMEKNMSGPPPWEGPAAASAPPKPGPRGVHLMTNEIIEVNGDRATAWSKWTYMARNAETRPFPVMVGTYEDVLVREKGEWKFLRRVVSGDIPFSEAPAKK